MNWRQCTQACSLPPRYTAGINAYRDPTAAFGRAAPSVRIEFQPAVFHGRESLAHGNLDQEHPRELGDPDRLRLLAGHEYGPAQPIGKAPVHQQPILEARQEGGRLRVVGAAQPEAGQNDDETVSVPSREKGRQLLRQLLVVLAPGVRGPRVNWKPYSSSSLIFWKRRSAPSGYSSRSPSSANPNSCS